MRWPLITFFFSVYPSIRYVFYVKVPNCQFSFFPTSVFWSRNFFLIVRFPDHCLLVPFFKNDCAKVAGIDDFTQSSFICQI